MHASEESSKNVAQANQSTVQIVGNIAEINEDQWNQLAGYMPLLSHAFLRAMEQSHSVGEGTGWQPCFITVTQGQQLVGAMPVYLKGHSYGEYVFDWSWADAYEQNGLAYYPKLLSAIPFSPVTSDRLLAQDEATKLLLIEAIESVMTKHQLSGSHVLFPSEADAELFERVGWLKRQGVQFRWENDGYETFDDFLSTLSHNKRKKIRQERRKVAQAGVQCRLLTGDKITEQDWDFFYDCYCNTYREHHSTPYLTRRFFTQISQSMAPQVLLIVAEQAGVPIASTLNFYNDCYLFGRYWGCTQFVSGLHFELCYYQAQQFCIERGIRFFEGGAQGEHKLARGFKPRPTCSYHKLANPAFERSIAAYLKRESGGIEAYTTELEERAPFKHTG